MQNQTFLEYLKTYRMKELDIVSTDKLIFIAITILRSKKTI